jgi:hypothetical protein
MSHHHPRWRMRCRVTGKRRFRDHREATRALRSAVRSRRLAAELGCPCQRREIRAYQCECCLGWHLTSWGDAHTPPVPVATVATPPHPGPIGPRADRVSA